MADTNMIALQHEPILDVRQGFLVFQSGRWGMPGNITEAIRYTLVDNQ